MAAQTPKPASASGYAMTVIFADDDNRNGQMSARSDFARHAHRVTLVLACTAPQASIALINRRKRAAGRCGPSNEKQTGSKAGDFVAMHVSRPSAKTKQILTTRRTR
jgi:hypothetical protein